MYRSSRYRGLKAPINALIQSGLPSALTGLRELGSYRCSCNGPGCLLRIETVVKVCRPAYTDQIDLTAYICGMGSSSCIGNIDVCTYAIAGQINVSARFCATGLSSCAKDVVNANGFGHDSRIDSVSNSCIMSLSHRVGRAAGVYSVCPTRGIVFAATGPSSCAEDVVNAYLFRHDSRIDSISNPRIMSLNRGVGHAHGICIMCLASCVIFAVSFSNASGSTVG